MWSFLWHPALRGSATLKAKRRVAAIELARAEEVKEELALVQQELEPLKRPYELFSRKLEATLENAEIRNGELETRR